MTPDSAGQSVPLQRAVRILWRRKFVCLAVVAVILAGGSSWLLTRPKVYQSASMVALLPVASNAGVLPNYPNLVASLVPTYVQLVSSPVLLDQVAATAPFHITEAQLASEVHGESMSSAAVISIVVDDANAVRAQEIAATTTAAFLDRLQRNGVVVPQVYGRPTVPDKPYGPNLKLVLAVLIGLALICGAAAGLARDRLAGQAAATPAGQAPAGDANPAASDDADGDGGPAPGAAPPRASEPSAVS